MVLRWMPVWEGGAQEECLVRPGHRGGQRSYLKAGGPRERGRSLGTERGRLLNILAEGRAWFRLGCNSDQSLMGPKATVPRSRPCEGAPGRNRVQFSSLAP